MSRKVTKLTFHFQNGGQWVVPVEFIGDIWISRVSTSMGRINGGDIEVIHPARYLQVEIQPNADTVRSDDINKGALETGMFETVAKNNNIKYMTVAWDEGEADVIYFPFEPSDSDSTHNKFMSAKVKDDKHLYIVIHEDKTVDDIY